MLLLLARRQDPLVRGAQCVGRGLGIRQRHLGQGALAGQGRPQLVRRVGHELALGAERGVEPLE